MQRATLRTVLVVAGIVLGAVALFHGSIPGFGPIREVALGVILIGVGCLL